MKIINTFQQWFSSMLYTYKWWMICSKNICLKIHNKTQEPLLFQ